MGGARPRLASSNQLPRWTMSLVPHSRHCLPLGHPCDGRPTGRLTEEAAELKRNAHHCFAPFALPGEKRGENLAPQLPWHPRQPPRFPEGTGCLWLYKPLTQANDLLHFNSLLKSSFHLKWRQHFKQWSKVANSKTLLSYYSAQGHCTVS